MGEKKPAPKFFTLRRALIAPAVPLKLRKTPPLLESNNSYDVNAAITEKFYSPKRDFFLSARKLQTRKPFQWLAPTATSLMIRYNAHFSSKPLICDNFIIKALFCQRFFSKKIYARKPFIVPRALKLFFKLKILPFATV